MARDYAVIPHAYLDEMAELNDAEFGALVRALLRYSRTGEPMVMDGNERFYIKRVMAEEDRHQRNYAELCERRSHAGQTAAMARWHGAGSEARGGANGYSPPRQPSRQLTVRTPDSTWMKDYD
ncbi:MAG: hypothetical protein E7425_10490 [Ruminococcaceae bacterium]|nr:hypothetical protein [Oscillospiraceae bacterium]